MQQQSSDNRSYNNKAKNKQTNKKPKKQKNYNKKQQQKGGISPALLQTQRSCWVGFRQWSAIATGKLGPCCLIPTSGVQIESDIYSVGWYHGVEGED